LAVFHPVAGLVFLPKPTDPLKKQEFLAAHSDGTVRVYELADAGGGKFNLNEVVPRRFSTGNAAAVNCVAITKGGETGVCSGFDSNIYTWDVATGRLKTTISAPSGHEDIVWRVAVSPAKDPDIGEEKIASASEDGTLRLFTISGKPLKDNTGMPAIKKELDANTNGFMGVAFATNNKVVYTAGNLKKKEEVKVWDITGLKP
jgi:WD40 repeat protein